jgi:hypothetical protein
MLWPIVLPFQISLAFWLIVIVIAGWVGPRWNIKRLKAVMLSLFVGMLLFIPSCAVVQSVLDPLRFGVFHYPDFAAVGDWRVQRYLPKGATDISIEKRWGGNGYRAKYKISKELLEEWFDESWAEGLEYSITTREEAQESSRAQQFEDLGWPELIDVVEYVGPSEDDWGGYQIWYSEKEELAYEYAAYW